MTAFFSSNKQYPITPKPITAADDAKTYQDIFNIQNTLRSLLRDLDTILEGYVQEAPEDGKLYGRKDGDWSEVVITPSEDSAYSLVSATTLAAATKDVVLTLPAYTDATVFKVEIFLTASSIDNQYVRLFYDADFTETNYSNSNIARNTTAVTSGYEANSAYVLDLGTNVTNSVASLTVYLGPGRKPLTFAESAAAVGTLTQLGLRTHTYKNVLAPTTITLRHNFTFGIGTVIKLYRIK